MLSSLFSTIYEIVCGSNPDFPAYEEQIFSSVGLLTFLAAVIFCLLFYVALGRWRMIWFNNVHWGGTIVFCAVTGFVLAFLSAKGTLGLVDGYLIRFALFNALYAAVFFIALSFLFKNFSIYSKRTPF
ncbi:hypothetical protein [Mucilaginibacter sp. PAMB04168]|uniref:hypothetical protein n=1 Tax=Mucilaginibacter sp. PAMB04168 TaxID=3138567 RepID=UPI0031F6107A